MPCGLGQKRAFLVHGEGASALEPISARLWLAERAVELIVLAAVLFVAIWDPAGVAKMMVPVFSGFLITSGIAAWSRQRKFTAQTKRQIRPQPTGTPLIAAMAYSTEMPALRPAAPPSQA
jgi:hypothetical protein